MVSRKYEESIDLPDGVDLPLLEALWRIIRSEGPRLMPQPMSYLSAEVTDDMGTYSSRSLKRALRRAERPLREVGLAWLQPGWHLSIHMQDNSQKKFAHSWASLQGPNRARILGMAEAMKRHVERHQADPSVSIQQPRLIDRIKSHPWTAGIFTTAVGTIIAVIALDLLP